MMELEGLVGRVALNQTAREAAEQFAMDYFPGAPPVRRFVRVKNGHRFTLGAGRYEIRKGASWYEIHQTKRD